MDVPRTTMQAVCAHQRRAMSVVWFCEADSSAFPDRDPKPLVGFPGPRQWSVVSLVRLQRGWRKAARCDVDCAQLVKLYGASGENDETRYSPAKCLGCIPTRWPATPI